MPVLTNVDPAKLRRWLIAIGVLYVLFPRDLIPDWFGRGLGLLDDASLVAFLVYFYRKRLRAFAARAAGATAGAAGGTRRGAAGETAGAESRESPYDTLGVSRSATRQEIDAAYKARLQEYHPDKVAHLGRELQELAHRKVLEIQEAHRRLRK